MYGGVITTMRLKDCHSFKDFRELARRRLPDPIFNYIDGAADDEYCIVVSDGSAWVTAVGAALS